MSSRKHDLDMTTLEESQPDHSLLLCVTFAMLSYKFQRLAGREEWHGGLECGKSTGAELNNDLSLECVFVFARDARLTDAKISTRNPAKLIPAVRVLVVVLELC